MSASAPHRVDQPFAPATPRPAATLVLMRADGGEMPGIEVLMLQRSPGADVLPGMHVFPGGVLEPDDAAAAAARLSPGLSPAQAQLRLADAESPAQALGYYITALRETFEETGILLARRPDGGAAALTETDLGGARGETGGARLALLDWLAGTGLCLATDDLIYFAHWITPKAVPRRFDVRFFLAEAPRGMRVSVDQTEIVGYRWVSPRQAIAAHAAGRMPMIEPTLHNLEVLQGFSSPDAARGALEGRPVRPVLPLMRIHPDGRRTLIYPWDPAYAADPEPT